MSLRETLMSNGFRSIPSTEQRLEGVERKIDQVVNKLDMILDSMTKPTQIVGPPEPIVAEFIGQMTSNPQSFGPSRPAALDVDAEYCSMKMPKGTEEEPKRTVGLPAKQQLENWIVNEFKSKTMFTLAAKAGIIKANITPKRKSAPSSHYYTHQLEIRSLDRKRKDGRIATFRPSLFGIIETREVIAYLESLGVNVNTNALNRV